MKTPLFYLRKRTIILYRYRYSAVLNHELSSYTASASIPNTLVVKLNDNVTNDLFDFTIIVIQQVEIINNSINIIFVKCS